LTPTGCGQEKVIGGKKAHLTKGKVPKRRVSKKKKKRKKKKKKMGRKSTKTSVKRTLKRGLTSVGVLGGG